MSLKITTLNDKTLVVGPPLNSGGAASIDIVGCGEAVLSLEQVRELKDTLDELIQSTEVNENELPKWSVVTKWVSEEELNVYVTLDGETTLAHRANLRKVLEPSDGECYALFLYLDDDGIFTSVMGVTNAINLCYLTASDSNRLGLFQTFDYKPELWWAGSLLLDHALVNTKWPIFRLIEQYGLDAEKEAILRSALSWLNSNRCFHDVGFCYYIDSDKIPLKYSGNVDLVPETFLRCFNTPLKIDHISKLSGLPLTRVVNGITLKLIDGYYVIDLDAPINMEQHVFRL